MGGAHFVKLHESFPQPIDLFTVNCAGASVSDAVVCSWRISVQFDPWTMFSSICELAFPIMKVGMCRFKREDGYYSTAVGAICLEVGRSVACEDPTRLGICRTDWD